MFRPGILGIGALVLVAAAGSVVAQTRARYGPVVTAYLTGLAEELNELEYQIRHQEIDRENYERARQRLTLQRRFVERNAGRGREDVVPELQVLAQDELKNLGVGRELQPELLAVGEMVDAHWRLASIETAGSAQQNRALIRFFIFIRVPGSGALPRAEGVPERKRDRALDLAAIETVVLDEHPPKAAAPPPAPEPAGPAPRADAGATEPPAMPAGPVPQLPRILHIYLPKYTDKAREKQIEGELILRALFQRDGKIRDIKVEKGLGYGLDQRAEDAARRIGFLPASVDGTPVDARAEIVFDFKLANVSVSVRAAQSGVVVKGARP